MKSPTFILLCKGDQGMSLREKNLFQIHLHQLDKINKQQILKHYIKSFQPGQYPINLITKNHQSYYLDLLFQKNLQLIDTQNEQLKLVKVTKFQFPLELQIVFPDHEYKISSDTIVSLKHFNLLKKIGQGTFAEIFIAESKFNRQLFTVKKINKTEHMTKGKKQMILNEFEALKHRHFHKVNLSYMFQTPSDLYFIMDYCPGGNIYELIKKQRQSLSHSHNSGQCSQCSTLDKDEKYWIWLQVTIMLTYFHENGILYRDLKPENILIDESGFVKLCDFGFCTKFERDQLLSELCGTLEYIPPELVLGQGYDKGIDLYALGILLYQLLANHSPFSDITFQNMKQRKVQKFKFDKRIFSQVQKDLIQSLTKQSSSQRLGYQSSLQIFKHNFFQQKQILSLIRDIVKRKVNPFFLMKIKFSQDKYKNQPQNEYQNGVKKSRNNQIYNNKQKYFQSGFNYLLPTVQIEEKIGPKFNSNY